MIDKVLILGIRRAKELIPDFEIAQMVGRCGRSYTESGEATIIVPMEDEEKAFEYMNSKPKNVSSKFAKTEDLCFHFIPEMNFRTSVSESDFQEWYSRSLGSYQGIKVCWDDVCDFLMENECATIQRNKLVLSSLGKISYNYYLRPEQAFRMKSRVEQISIRNEIDEISLSWALAFSNSYKDLAENMDFQQYASEISGKGYLFEEDSAEAFAWFCLLSQKKPKIMRNEIISLKKDSDRMFGALKEICKLLDFQVEDKLDMFLLCAKRGIPKELSNLAMEFPDAKKQILFELDSLGIHNQREMSKKCFQIENYGTNSLKEYCGQLCGSKATKAQRDL